MIRTAPPAFRRSGPARQPLPRPAPLPALRAGATPVSRALLPVRAAPRTPLARSSAPPVAPEAPSTEVRPRPYPDYARRFTPEGGIAITYKDLDPKLWRTLLRGALWLAATGATGWFILNASPLAGPLLNGIGFVGMAVSYALILFKDVEVYRSVEIRPDCMIIEGEDVFWRENMELAWPSFRADAEGNQVLCGVYGTRWVEYLTGRRFDPNDRAPEVFAGHLQAAIQQLWAQPG